MPESAKDLKGEVKENVGDATYDPLFPYAFGLTY